MTEPRFLFLLTEGFNETVIDSQVVDPVVLLGREGIPFDLLALVNGRSFVQRRAYYRERQAAIAARTRRRVEIRPFARKRDRIGLVLGVAQLGLDYALGGFRRTVVHARGEWAAYQGATLRRMLPNVHLVYDARGDIEAEHLLEAERRGLSARRTAANSRKIERARAAAVEYADHVLCVSTPLRDLLVERYGLDSDRCTVVPCAADERKFHLDEVERSDTRAALGLVDRFVVVYPGSFGRWHFDEETFRVVRGLLDADESIFFLVITPDVEAANSLARMLLPQERFAIRSATHDEMPRLLRACDLGILLRAHHPLNVVACPTKFAEFVMCGLPVLISSGIGDCSSFVAENGIGIVLNEPDPKVAVRAVAGIRADAGNPARERIAALGRDRFSRQRYVRELAHLYGRLASGR
jgi:glycosyltransferase involved in cell wall biosynthesis